MFLLLEKGSVWCRWTGVCALVALLLAVPARAQAPKPDSLPIAAGDLLSVQVFRESDLDTKARVVDAGTVTVPLIGAVPVEGLSAPEAASAMEKLFEQRHLLLHPQVSVSIEESAAKQVAVLGEVGRPGVVLVSSPRSLLDVLAEAGGLLKTADRRVTLRRPGQAPVTVLVANDATTQLTQGPVMVSPGDTVLVPRAGIVYVLGDVGHPGGYLMQDDAKLSLLQALSLASGVTRTAAEKHARLVRTVRGVPVELPLQLKSIEAGHTPDIQLQNDDIVYIPFSFARNMALGAPSIAASASSALVYAAW